MLKHAKKRVVSGLIVTAGLCAVASLVAAQQQPTPQPIVPIAMKPLKDIYISTGGAGQMNSSNEGVIIGSAGVIVVDVKLTSDSQNHVLADIAKLTPKPVTTAIITHADSDHAYGLSALPKGVTIIAQENAKKALETSLSNPQGGAPKDYLPTHTVAMKESLKIEGVRFQLLHFAPAHTSGDLIIYLPDKKIVFTGDIIDPMLPFPLVHPEPEKLGSSEGWVETVKAILKLNADTYVPGHGEVQTKADVQKELVKVEERRAQIKALVAQGKSLDEVKQAVGEAGAAGPGGRGSRLMSFTESVYHEDGGK